MDGGNIKLLSPKVYQIKSPHNLKNKFILKKFDKKLNLYVLEMIILIIMIFIILLYFHKIKTIKNNENEKKNYISDAIGNYGLYNYFKYPQISLLINNCDKWKINYNQILNFIINLKYKSLNDIEILLFLSKNSFNIIKNNNFSLIEKAIKIKVIENRNLLDNIFYSMNLIKGKFIIVLNNYIEFDKNELEKFYNLTKGKIDNIFKFKTKSGRLIFLIKTKILRDIIDNGLQFKNYINLINYIFSIPKPQLNFIYIALCPNDYYSPMAYVAMSSILNSKDYYTYIVFYLIIPNNFSDNNIQFLYSLYEQYDYFNITFIKMDNRYDKAFISYHISVQTYYRCSLGELLPNLNKIIYLDTDVIIYKDLSNFFNLNFNGKVILGQVGAANNSPKTGYYMINNGILLLNLKEMRNMQVEKKILNLLQKGYKFSFHDQTIINKLLRKYLGIFPPKYHIRPFKNHQELLSFNNKTGNLYDNDLFYFSWKYPTIKHFLGYYKPIYNNINNKNMEDWWFIARKSKYFIKKTKNITNIFNFTNLI
jgi:lipopolysaccharide biosynthesis glycosyltransferase